MVLVIFFISVNLDKNETNDEFHHRVPRPLRSQ